MSQIQFKWVPHTLGFNFDARTSRGRLKTHTVYYFELSVDENVGYGECAPLIGLSPDHEKILDFLKKLPRGFDSRDQIFELIKTHEVAYPSFAMGMGTALKDLISSKPYSIYSNDFINGRPIPINGLIWMGDFDFMFELIDKKIKEGLDCLKF